MRDIKIHPRDNDLIVATHGRGAYIMDRVAAVQQITEAKLFATRIHFQVADTCLQLHGGYGYMNEYAVARFWRDCKVLEIGEGTNEMQRIIIARHLVQRNPV